MQFMEDVQKTMAMFRNIIFKQTKTGGLIWGMI